MRTVSDTSPRLQIWPDAGALTHGVADWLLGLALATEGRFSLCLSGGSTPKALYQFLGQPPFCDRMPWARIHLFWGDERFVTPDDPLSNFRMVREALLDHAPIPPANVHPMPTGDADPSAAATAYQATLQAFYGDSRLHAGRPLFDVTLLGLGPDGHTASLFPGSGVLAEREGWVAAVIGAKAEARITLTYTALESSRHTAFLVAGLEKAPVLARLREGDEALPAARLARQGEAAVFCDSAAAGRA